MLGWHKHSYIQFGRRDNTVGRLQQRTVDTVLEALSKKEFIKQKCLDGRKHIPYKFNDEKISAGKHSNY